MGGLEFLNTQPVSESLESSCVLGKWILNLKVKIVLRALDFFDQIPFRFGIAVIEIGGQSTN